MTAVLNGFGSCRTWAAGVCAAVSEEEFCQQVKRTCIGSGSKVLPHVSKPSGTSSSRQERAFGASQAWKVCLCAAQLTLAPDKTPDAAPAGRAGSCSARRTASRRLQVTPAEPFFSRGKRRAACPLARGCVLRVNRLIVCPATSLAAALFPRPLRVADDLCR